MNNVESRGSFVWHELITQDPGGAAAFYPRVVSWKSEPWDKIPGYRVWLGAEGPAGGLMAPTDGSHGAGAYWLPFVGVTDAAATVASVQRLGGRVITGATVVPTGGTYAVFADPQGATCGVYAAGASSSGASSGGLGGFSWHELATSDVLGALDFYSELFGWARGRSHDMGEMGPYQIFMHGGKEVGGIYNLTQGMSPSWLSYVRVADASRAAGAAKAGGGRIINGPIEVPGGDWVAQILDPQGAAFAVHEPKRAQAAAKPSVKKAATKSAPKPPPKKTAKKASNKGRAPKKSAAKRTAAKKQTRSVPAKGRRKK